jgi:O-antigen/teichoic acid export membrane protein
MQGDPSRIRWSFCKAIRLLMTISCPIYLGMAAAAGPLVETLFGAKWAPMAPLVAILALAMPFMTLQVMFAPVNNALGRPGLTTRIALVGAILMPCAFLVGIRFGTTGLALAWLTAFPVFTVITARIAGTPMGLRLGEIAGAASLPILLSAAMAGVVVLVDWMLPPLPHVAHLGILVATGGAAYAGMLLTVARPLLKEIVALVVRKEAPARVA